MKLYGIIRAYYAGSGVEAFAVNEKGKIISQHFCSSEGFAKSDLGFSKVYMESSASFNSERKEVYKKLGYDEFIWIGFNEDDFSNDLRDKISDTLAEWHKFQDLRKNSLESISKMADQGNLVNVRGIDWYVEKSNLPIEELKKKNAYSAGQLFSNSSITFEKWNEQHG